MKKSQFLKALGECPSTYVETSDANYAWVRDGVHMYYFDLADFPRSVNLSTFEPVTNSGFKCIYYKRCPIDKFDWIIEKSRALISLTFNIDF